jgi:hypothetical protein
VPFLAAPELGRLDHPIGLVDGHQHGVVHIGHNTRAGLDFMLSHAMRKWLDHSAHWTATATAARCLELLDRLALELGVRPDPDRGVVPEAMPIFDTPVCWRYESSDDEVGVLAPADAFAGRAPIVADFDKQQPLEPVLENAAQMLDAGHPATALLGRQPRSHDTRLPELAVLLRHRRMIRAILS